MSEETTVTSVSEQDTEVTTTTSDTASDTDTDIETGTGSSGGFSLWLDYDSTSEDIEFIIPEMLTMNEALQNKTFAEIHNQQILILKALEGIQEQQVQVDEIKDLYNKADEIYTVGVYLLVVLIFYGAYKLFSGLFSQI